MTKLFTSRTVSLNLFLVLLALVVSCGSEAEEPVLDKEAFKAQITEVIDVENNVNASDIKVSFTPAASDDQISEYRVVYLKANSTTVVTVDLIRSLNSIRYSKVVGRSNNSSVTLSSTQLSIDGEDFSENEDYQVYILSVGTFNAKEVLAISNASSIFKALDTSVFDANKYTVQISSVADVDNNGNSSDILVSFQGATARSKVQEYRIIVAKSTSVTNVSLETSKALPIDRYTSVLNEDISFKVNLTQEQLDFDGQAVEQTLEYQVFVLTIGTSQQETVYALSKPSDIIQLILKPETSTLVENFMANDALSVDTNGNIYASNYGVYDASIIQGNGKTALKVSPSGEVEEYVSNLASPVGNAIDASGNFYVNNDNDFTSGDLLKVATDGTQAVIATIGGYPAGILLGTDGNFYISNYSNPTISKVTPNGALTNFSNDSRLTGGVGIAYDDNGNIIVGNLISGDILSIDPNGAVSLIATIPTVVQNSVVGYITFFEGHVYATGISSNIIYKVSLDGTIVDFAGNGTRASIDGELTKASFNGPNGITVDKKKRVLYVTEASGRLRVIPLD